MRYIGTFSVSVVPQGQQSLTQLHKRTVDLQAGQQRPY